MTDDHVLRMDAWDQWRDDDELTEAETETETETVRRLLSEQINGDLHGLAITRQQGETTYCVVSRSTTWDQIDESVDMDIPVTDIRTVVVDEDSETVKLSDNGLWIPGDTDVSESLTRLLSRTTSDKRGSTDGSPLTLSAVDGLDAESLLSKQFERETVESGQHVDKMDSHGGIDPSRPWGYGGGPPPEVSKAVERLQEAGLDPEDHLSRLVWGKKEPMDRQPRPVEELTGNYGIELQPRDSGLIAIDVDYPDEFPDSELPETFEVSSPHGDDRRRHIVFRCDDKERLADEIGAWAVQGVDWGDLWVGDRYLVGPGSQLSEFGCDNGDHDRGERGGCEACEDPAGGHYRVISDKPIATVSADRILSLLDESGFANAERRDGPTDPDPPERDDERDDGLPTCDNCGAARDPEDLTELATVTVCRGECNE